MIVMSYWSAERERAVRRSLLAALEICHSRKPKHPAQSHGLIGRRRAKEWLEPTDLPRGAWPPHTRGPSDPSGSSQWPSGDRHLFPKPGETCTKGIGPLQKKETISASGVLNRCPLVCFSPSVDCFWQLQPYHSILRDSCPSA